MGKLRSAKSKLDPRSLLELTESERAVDPVTISRGGDNGLLKASELVFLLGRAEYSGELWGVTCCSCVERFGPGSTGTSLAHNSLFNLATSYDRRLFISSTFEELV